MSITSTSTLRLNHVLVWFAASRCLSTQKLAFSISAVQIPQFTTCVSGGAAIVSWALSIVEAPLSAAGPRGARRALSALKPRPNDKKRSPIIAFLSQAGKELPGHDYYVHRNLLISSFILRLHLYSRSIECSLLF